MTSTDASSPQDDQYRLSTEVTVPLLPEEAFAAFARELDRWWPPVYTWSQDVLKRITIEPKAGGACYEVGPHDFRCDWGRVTNFDEPDRLIFLWQISAKREPVPDPGQASTVQVSFVLSGTGTRVLLEHRDFQKHGEDGGWYRDAMASEMGWPRILEAYRSYAMGRGASEG